MNVDLKQHEARVLSLLLSQDLREMDAMGLHSAIVQIRQEIWEKLQPACGWDSGEED